MKQKIKKQIRKPFNMDSIWNNDNPHFVMRDGTPVDNLQYISEITFYPVVAFVNGEYNSYTKEGHYISSEEEAPEDLFEVVEIEVEVDSVKRFEFTEDEVVHLLFTLQSAQDSFGDKKFFPEDSELKESYNLQLQSWIEKCESLYKKILLERWTELPTPPDEYYGSLTDEYLQYLINQNK